MHVCMYAFMHIRAHVHGDMCNHMYKEGVDGQEESYGMYACMYVRMYVCMYVCSYVSVYVGICNMCICTQRQSNNGSEETTVSVYVCMYVRMYIEMKICKCIHIYIYMYIC